MLDFSVHLWILYFRFCFKTMYFRKINVVLYLVLFLSIHRKIETSMVNSVYHGTLTFFLFFLSFFLNTGSHGAKMASSSWCRWWRLELLILFPSPPESWDCRSTLSQWGLSGMMEPRAPCILGKCSTNQATSSGQL